jgi:hypothetical protein
VRPDDGPMYTDPAVIVAISCCWLVRSRKSPGPEFAAQTFQRHPETCQFCDFPLDVLMGYIVEFNDWVAAGSLEAGRVMVTWGRLPRDTQHGLVMKAGLAS